MDAHKFKKSLFDIGHRLSGLVICRVRVATVHFGDDVALVGKVPPLDALFMRNLETEAHHEALPFATSMGPLALLRLRVVPIRFVEVQRQMLEY